MRVKLLFISILLIILCSIIGCDKELFEYNPYELRLPSQYNKLNEKQIRRIETQNHTPDTIRFILMGDTHRSFDEIEDFVKDVEKKKEIDFVIHAGDITDFGLKKEYIWAIDRLNKLSIPYVVLIGNHDILGEGKFLYQKILGHLNFSFKYNNTKFIFLNTNALEFDYSTPVPDFNFIREEAKDSTNIEQTIAVMHVQPGDLEFNNNIKDVFQEELRKQKNLLFCLHGHAHRLMENEFFNDGIIYYGCDDLIDRNYIIFTVSKNDYKYEIVYF